MIDLVTILNDAHDELEEYLEDFYLDCGRRDVEDHITEIADSHVPIYTSELMELSSDPDIYNRDDDGLLGRDSTLEEHVRVRVYLAISEHLHGAVDCLIDNLFDECSNCLETKKVSELDENDGGICDECVENMPDNYCDECDVEFTQDEAGGTGAPCPYCSATLWHSKEDYDQYIAHRQNTGQPLQ